MQQHNPFRPAHFARVDESDDEIFYDEPRLVTHIDDGAIAAAGRLYAALLPPDGEVLDLMSSWVSHLPEHFTVKRLVGLGMNEEELRQNPRLTERVVQNLNRQPVLPFEDNTFDGCVVTVSVQYLTKPVEVFREVHRVLRPNAPFVVTFSNRCFPTKAVAIWRALDDADHARLVGTYFELSATWEHLLMADLTVPREGGYADPLFAVYARKPASTGDHEAAGSHA